MSLKYGIQVRFDEDVRDLAKQFPRAAVAVLNRAVTRSQKIVSDKLNAEYNLPKSVIKKRIYTFKANKNHLSATIRFSQRGINPYWFLKDKKNPTTRREPVILEIKKGSSIFVGNKIFTNIGKKSGKLKVMFQPKGNPRDHLAPMKFIKGGDVFNSKEIIPLIKNFVEPYMRDELPRVIKAFYKTGRDLI